MLVPVPTLGIRFKKRSPTKTLPETNSSHLKMHGWNTILSLWGPFSLLWKSAKICSLLGSAWKTAVASWTFPSTWNPQKTALSSCMAWLPDSYVFPCFSRRFSHHSTTTTTFWTKNLQIFAFCAEGRLYLGLWKANCPFPPSTTVKRSSVQLPEACWLKKKTSNLKHAFQGLPGSSQTGNHEPQKCHRITSHPKA